MAARKMPRAGGEPGGGPQFDYSIYFRQVLKPKFDERSWRGRAALLESYRLEHPRIHWLIMQVCPRVVDRESQLPPVIAAPDKPRQQSRQQSKARPPATPRRGVKRCQDQKEKGERQRREAETEQ